MATSAAWTCITFPLPAPPAPGLREAAERIEAAVFRTSFGESEADLRSYYADHEDQSVFVVARGDAGADAPWAGMLRLGLPGAKPSLSAEDAAAPPFGVDVGAALAAGQDGPVVLLDVLTAAVRARYRNRGLFERLLAAAVEVADEHSCTHLVAMVDRRVLVYLRRRRLGMTVHTGLHPYYGSPATAAASVPVGVLREWLVQA